MCLSRARILQNAQNRESMYRLTQRRTTRSRGDGRGAVRGAAQNDAVLLPLSKEKRIAVLGAFRKLPRAIRARAAARCSLF